MVIFRLGPGALLPVVFCFLGPLVAAGFVNRTIDDSFGDSQTGLRVTYLPATGLWKDQSCIGSCIVADTSQTFKTYTATSTPTLNNPSGSITMKFNGTAIYVFFVLANTEPTFARFDLDGNAPENFLRGLIPNSQDLQYNQLVFSQTNLINPEHTLVVSTSGVDTKGYVNFDYAIYTHDDDAPLPLPSAGSSSSSTSTSSSTSKTESSTSNQSSSLTPTGTIAQADSQSGDKKFTPAGAIAGGVIGGLAILVAIVLSRSQAKKETSR